MACQDSIFDSGCSNPNLASCNNPCRVSQVNTAACESLPSQIENFSTQFFGSIQKTEVDGKVVWTLPCNLAVGLPNNPRSVNEGLSCYFLRLFEDGIIGLTGPQGAKGDDGTNGNNTYSVLLHSFTQPTLGNPNIQILSSFNPAIIAGEYIFIQSSGWYLITATDGNGTLFLTLVQSVPGASGTTVTAGKLIVPTGPPGAAITGPQGAQGPPGPQGPSGAVTTSANGFYFANAGANYPVGVVYTQVDFVNSKPEVTLPQVGKYLITAVVTVLGQGAVAPADSVNCKLVNTSTSTDVQGSEKILSNIALNQYIQFILNVIVETVATDQTVALFAKASSAAVFHISAINNTTISYVRVT